MQTLKRILGGLRRVWRQRYYWASRWFGAEVPVHNLSWLPDNFTVQRLGDTGLQLVEQFCTQDESERLIALLREQLGQGGGDCFVNPVSKTGSYSVAGEGQDDPLLLPLLYRASVLTGRPYTALTEILLGRVRGAASPAAFPRGDGRHVVRCYLNDAEGGAASFTRLNLAVMPRAGRALCWSEEGSSDVAMLEMEETTAADGNSERWFVQLRFGDAALRPDEQGSVNPPQARQGAALNGGETMPAGVWSPETIDLEAVFGQPDKMEGLL